MINLPKIESVLLNGKEDDAKKVLAELLEQYRRPSFGSMSKRDVDNMMFKAMQDLGLIDVNPQAYEVVQALHVTSSKARNLIYASALSREQEFDVDDELKTALSHPRFLPGIDKMIGIDIDNPLLIDHLKYKLRDLGHITDGSFNQDMVKMTPEALAALYESYMPEQARVDLIDKLKELGIVKDEDATFKKAFKDFITTVRDKIYERGAEGLIDKAIETMPKILAGTIKTVALAALL